MLSREFKTIARTFRCCSEAPITKFWRSIIEKRSVGSTDIVINISGRIVLAKNADLVFYEILEKRSAKCKFVIFCAVVIYI